MQCLKIESINVVGGLFDNSKSKDAEVAFKYAVDIANTDILSSFHNRLEAVPKRVPTGNEFKVSKRVCEMMRVSTFVSILTPLNLLTPRVKQILQCNAG